MVEVDESGVETKVRENGSDELISDALSPSKETTINANFSGHNDESAFNLVRSVRFSADTSASTGEVRINEENTPEVRVNSQKDVYRTSLLGVRSVRSVRNVRFNLENLTNLTPNSVFSFCFGESLLNKVLGFLMLSPTPVSYGEIATGLGVEPASVNTIMNRNEDLFQATRDGAVKLFQLAPVGKYRAEQLVEAYKRKQAFQMTTLSKEEELLAQYENLRMEARKILDELQTQRVGNSIYLDFDDVSMCSPAFGERLLNCPDESIAALKDALVDSTADFRFTNLPRSVHVSIENLRDEHINKLVVLEGRSVSLSSVRPIIKEAKYECANCGAEVKVIPSGDKVAPPGRCKCGGRTFKTLSYKRVNGSNLMLEDLQEKTENPHLQRLRCTIENDLVQPQSISIFTPGNEIKACGVLRHRTKEVKGGISTNIETFFEVHHAELFQQEISLDGFSDEDVAQFRELAAQVDEKGLTPVRESFAPEVFGYEHVKEAAILQLCARRNELKMERARNKPNILLIGDPGVSKSLIGRFAVSITPGSRKALGGGSSGVGLTASTIKEEDDLGGWRVEPGAMVLAKELLFIDELNNLSDDDKPKLQEGMNEQTVTINKANLHVTLKVTCGILAAANPANGFFDLNSDLIRQFNIPIPIMNRFDIIFIVKDHVNEERDRNIANRMLDRETGCIVPTLNRDFLRKFLVFVREQPDPVITPDVKRIISELYANVRKGDTRRVVINPRFVESLTRLVKASAKLRLSKKVEAKDIDRCMSILSQSHYSIDHHVFFEDLEARR